MGADERLKRVIGELHFALAIAEARAEAAEKKLAEQEAKDKSE
jgi:hypothetical protein